ncbi:MULTISPECIES: hypothetical protein [Bacillus cereus group]|uniref:hypothetical protein n=1 Tax=Bacillus cereus group TaxID=86661 RepID=UPI000BECD2F7|nr:hypothetical protein [Bacillus toyonensis]PEG15635.1 hypothetical protein COO04_13850 [Bacillus toyonensis]
MELINKLGISKSLAQDILTAIAVGNVASWLLVLIPGPGWATKAAISAAEIIVETSGEAAAVAY